MKRDSKLSLALHALGHMAGSPDHAVRSEDLAPIGPTNPVVVRRVLGLLRAAGIVTSAKGHDGGWRLARAAEAISVADVYHAVGEPIFSQPDSAPKDVAHCAIEQALRGTMDRALSRAEATLLTEISSVSIADLAARMRPC